MYLLLIGTEASRLVSRVSCDWRRAYAGRRRQIIAHVDLGESQAKPTDTRLPPCQVHILQKVDALLRVQAGNVAVSPENGFRLGWSEMESREEYS